MAAAEAGGCYADRAHAALEAGCDMVVVCNNPAGTHEVLEAFRDHQDPVAQSRLARLHGRPAQTFERLTKTPRWHSAVETAARLTAETTLDMDLEEPL